MAVDLTTAAPSVLWPEQSAGIQIIRGPPAVDQDASFLMALMNEHLNSLARSDFFVMISRRACYRRMLLEPS